MPTTQDTLSLSAISHMPSVSAHWQVVPSSATSLYSGIIAAVITIAVSIILSRKLWGRGNNEGIPKQEHPNTSKSQLINQDTRDEHDLNISTPADHSAGDGGHHCIPVPSRTPPTISELQFVDQDARDKDISTPAQASTTLRPPGDMGSEEVPPITLSQGSSNFQISETNATIIRNDDGHFTRIQRNLAYDYITNSTMLPKINHNLKQHVLTQSVMTLPRAEAVFHDYKSAPCFRRTTVALLREIADCVTGSSKYRMSVLSGPPASGKSTVAYTIASRAAYLNLLGAFFCFSRDETDRNNAKRFFITIAHQLCLYNEAFSKAIGDVLETEDGSAATTEDPQDQLQSLILDPLRSIVQSRSRPILIVVDALDECDGEDAFSVLTGLSQLVRDLPSFKIILTTRPQTYLDRFLSSESGYICLYLQDIENKVVDGDIRLYLNHCLSLDQVQMRFPKRQWCASDEEIDSLVRTAGRFFIISSTAVRYILDKTASNPAAQMQKLLRASVQDHTPFKDLDRFYTIILRDVVPEDCGDDGIVSRYQSIVGTLILVQHPLSVSALAQLIGIDVEEIRAVLDKLQSVILLGDDDVPHIYHQSFPEYLTDQARCKDPHLRIDPRIRHAQIATHCFRILDEHLKYNILGLGDPARFMSNKDGLEKDGITDEQLEEKIPQQLCYACVYWVNHLETANAADADLVNVLEKCLAKHMLHWFEVLSLVGKLDSARLAIDVVLKLLKLSSDFHQLLSDALRFIEKFSEIIKRSALHMYYSALLFTPTDSHLYRRYIKEAVHNICAIEGGPYQHAAFIAKLSHGRYVDVVKFSLDSSLLMFYSAKSTNYQGQLKIWDAVMDTPISTVPGDNFAVANDFSTVASSEDNIATLYNLNGSPSGAKFNTSSKIQKLALSSESSRVAAALSDGTVWLWESRNAELIDNFDGFEDNTHWPQLEFSPTGTRLAYSSANSIVKLRDGINGRFIADLRCGSQSHKFEFSADGSRIAAVSYKDSLTLWNSESGELIGNVRDDVGCQGLAISPNGSLIATWGDDKVTLWSENNDLVQIKVPGLVGSLAFSLDNILAIVTDSDILLYDVKTRTFLHSLPFHGIPGVLAFSPDCTRLAAYSGGSMNLWDIRGIAASDPPSNTTHVTALALSRDCSRLACGFKNGTVELWSTSPTKRRIASHLAHTGMVRSLGFGPDGGLFASGSFGATIKLWNGEDGSLRGTVKAPMGSELNINPYYPTYPAYNPAYPIYPTYNSTYPYPTYNPTQDPFINSHYHTYYHNSFGPPNQQRSNAVSAVTLSNSVLVGAGGGGVTLWSLDTLSLIHTFPSFEGTVSIAENNALIAVTGSGYGVYLLDAVNHTTITKFDVGAKIYTMTFLPDNLQLVAQCTDGSLRSFNLIDKYVTKGAATLEHLLRLPNISLWHGVPIWHCQDRDSEQHYFKALFPQHKSPVPVLWIPGCIGVTAWTQGSSMIALGCRDGRVILLRLPANHVG